MKTPFETHPQRPQLLADLNIFWEKTQPSILNGSRFHRIHRSHQRRCRWCHKWAQAYAYIAHYPEYEGCMVKGKQHGRENTRKGEGSGVARNLRHGVRNCTTLTISPFSLITQPESWYSFYRPTEGRRLNRSNWLLTLRRWFTSPQTVTHPGTNWAWRSFQGHAILWRWISHKRLKIRPQLVQNVYRKPYPSFRTVPFTMTLGYR